ncbi:hypothetical protein Q7P36_000147 [Cladosporium allicinum]
MAAEALLYSEAALLSSVLLSSNTPGSLSRAKDEIGSSHGNSDVNPSDEMWSPRYTTSHACVEPSDHHIDGTDVETPRFAAWRGVAWEGGRSGVDSYIDPVDNFVYSTRLVRQQGARFGKAHDYLFDSAEPDYFTARACATAASVAFLARGGPTYVASERAAQANQPRARSRRERHVNVDGSVLSREYDDPGQSIVVAPAHTGYKGWAKVNVSENQTASQLQQSHTARRKQ